MFNINKNEREETMSKKYQVQITKKDGSQFIHGEYKTKAEAEEFVKWYKTGDLRYTKKIEII